MSCTRTHELYGDGDIEDPILVPTDAPLEYWLYQDSSIYHSLEGRGSEEETVLYEDSGENGSRYSGRRRWPYFYFVERRILCRISLLHVRRANRLL